MIEYSYFKYSSDDFEIEADLPLFHQTKFVNRSDTPVTLFVLLKDNELAAFIYFKVDAELAISLPNSSFGGVTQLTIVENSAIVSFLNFALDELKSIGVKLINIIDAPNFYKIANWSNEIYQKCGFKMLFSNINQYIKIDDKIFTEKINRNRRRMISNEKCSEFQFRQLPNERLTEIYEVIKTNRTQKGYELSMSLNEISKDISSFPDRYYMFGVIYKKQLIAGAICVKVTSSVIYDFYHGEIPEYVGLSPVTKLMEGIYNFGKQNGFKIIDLGTSAIKGKLNKGVCDFKKSLGAQDDYKVTYEWHHE